MRQSKHEFYATGYVEKKRASVTMDFKRLDDPAFQNMNDETRRNLIEYSNNVIESCKAFCKELKEIAEKENTEIHDSTSNKDQGN